MQHITYISLGTNLGNKLKNLENAIHLIDTKIGGILKIASIYKTESVGFKGNSFYNTVIKVTTLLASETLIQTLLFIEKELGRVRATTGEYINRTIDLDVLLFDDEIISSKKLTVPHPRMLERKFVLVPLVEIAKNTIHPITKNNLAICLKNCPDNSEIIKIDAQITRPILITEKYNYIAIEGNIGAGKTSLAKMIAENFNSTVILERFAENSFLPKFYQNKERYAFPLEMRFLADRHQQLTESIDQANLTKSTILSDYAISKSLLFAKITLPKEEYLLYKKYFNLISKNITKPSLYIYLHQNIENALANIQSRGRKYEQNITASYLQKIETAYLHFINTQQSVKTLVIDVSKLDFVNRLEDYLSIIHQIKTN